MTNNDLKLLDCTLRDGGYVNDWKWGYHNAREIIRFLTKAKVDFVEVGFLRNVDEYNKDITVCNTIEELNQLLPEKTGNTMYSAMAMRSNYNIEKLTCLKTWCGRASSPPRAGARQKSAMLCVWTKAAHWSPLCPPSMRRP